MTMPRDLKKGSVLKKTGSCAGSSGIGQASSKKRRRSKVEEKERKDFNEVVERLEERIMNILEQIDRWCHFLPFEARRKLERSQNLFLNQEERFPHSGIWLFSFDPPLVDMGGFTELCIQKKNGERCDYRYYLSYTLLPESRKLEKIKALLHNESDYRGKAERIIVILRGLAIHFETEARKALSSLSPAELSQLLERAYAMIEKKGDEIGKLSKQKEELEQKFSELKSCACSTVRELRQTKGICKSIKIAQIRENLERALKSRAKSSNGIPAPDSSRFYTIERT